MGAGALNVALLIAVVLCSQDGSRTTQEDRSIFVDTGACPGEGCGYGTWVTVRETSLRAAPDLESAIVVALSGGVIVEAVTGEVHTVPGRFVVHWPLKVKGMFTSNHLSIKGVIN